MKLDSNFFILSWKKVGAIVTAWFAAVFLHNLVSALLGLEEVIFFIVAIFLIPIYFMASLAFTVFVRLRR